MQRLLPFRKTPVLAYHQVATTTRVHDPLKLAVTVDHFRSQMKYLSEHGFQTLTPEGFSLENTKGKARRLLLTFDDGYLNNYTSAFPVLQDYGLTATIFIVTDCVGKTNIWDPFEQMPLMDWHQIKEMTGCGISFQSHTRSHPDLTKLPARDAISELAGSKKRIEEATGMQVCYLAYPYGNCDPKTIQWTATAGYSHAFGAGMLPAGPYSLERFQITCRDSEALFRLKASGWAGWLRKILHYLNRGSYVRLNGKFNYPRREDDFSKS